LIRQLAAKLEVMRKNKICTVCGEEKPLSEFSFTTSIRQWDSWCFPCKRRYAASYRDRIKKDPALQAKRKAVLQEWYRKLRSDSVRWAKHLAEQRERRKAKWRDDPDYRRSVKSKNNRARLRRMQNPIAHASYLEKTRAKTREMKSIVFQSYGNRCSCCGESEQSFLVIDHVNGGGAVHRKAKRIGVAFYRLVIKEGFPDTYRILCCNCNWGRFVNGGTCPHQLPKGSETISSESTPEAIAGGSAQPRYCPWREMTWPTLHGDMQQPTIH
jgi:hypothetical protein